MPIQGLTNQAPSFPEIGQLRKGAAKPDEKHIGKDLTYFRFTSDVEGVVEAFEKAYDGEPRLINVFLPFASVDENLIAWREIWTASGLVHRCDGETVVLWQREDGSYSTERKPCQYKDKPNRPCKPVGRLKVIIPELKRLAYVTVHTTSIHDIMNLDAQLRALAALKDSGDLRGIPLQLRRRPKMISTPSGKNGGRARREKWLLSIEAAPSWVELQLAAQEAAAVPQITHVPAAIPATVGPVIDNKTGEILGEPDWDEDAMGEISEPDDIEDGEYTEAPEPPKQQAKPKSPQPSQPSGNGGGYGPADLKKRLDALLEELRANVGHYKDTAHLFKTMKEIRSQDFSWPPPQNDADWGEIVQQLADYATAQGEAQQEGLPL